MIRKCTHCDSTNVKLRQQIFRNGKRHIAWYCVDCDRWADSKDGIKWISHDIIKGWIASGRLKCNLEELPIVADYRDDTPCEICGDVGGVEFNHWLPRAFADEVDDYHLWPGAWLCPKHHQIWHYLVTPYLTGPNWRERYESSRYKKTTAVDRLHDRENTD